MGILPFLIFGFLAIALILYFLIKNQYKFWKNNNVMQEEPDFFYGNMKKVKSINYMHHFLKYYYEKYKNKETFVGIYMFVKTAIIPIDLELTKNILIKDFSSFSDRGLFHNERDDPLTGHLFLLDGQKWTRMRKKLSPTFTSGKMKFMFPTIVTVGEQFGEVFEGLVGPAGSNIEIKELLGRFTTDVIGTCAFGIECNSLKDPNAEFRIMGKKVFSDPRHGKLGTAFLTIFPNLGRKLHMKLSPNYINDFFMKVVRETVAYRETNSIKRNDFLDILIDMKNNEQENGITIEEMAAQVFVFFLAGFETSSTTMGFCLYELAKNQNVQTKLRNEINAILEKYNGKLTYESMSEMHYMEQVIMETLRKYPVVTTLMRQALNDYTDSISGKIIPKDTKVLIPVYSIHFDEDLYPQPENFDPERFTPEAIQNRHPMSWLPFGDGPRNCIGLRFGKMQIRVGLVTLLSKFKFVLDEVHSPKTIEYDTDSPVLSSKGGIVLKVQKLN